MRLLFYTATAVFLILAGVFAFYAMQSSEQAGAARVVLSIDANERPSADVGRAQSSGGDTLTKEDAAPAAPEQPVAEGLGASSEASQDVAAQSNGPVPSGLEGERNAFPEAPAAAIDQNPEPSYGSEPQVGDAGQAATEEPAQQQVEPDPAALPGTMLSGLDDSVPAEPREAPERLPQDPPSQPVEQDVASAPASDPSGPTDRDQPAPREEQQIAALRGSTSAEDLPQAKESAEPVPTNGIAQDADPAAQGTPNAAVSEQSPPSEGQQPRTPAEEKQLKANFDAFLSTLNDRQENGAAPAAKLAPPVPPRRPESGTASADGWAGRQVAAKTDKPRKRASGGNREVRIAILLRGVGRDDRNSSDAVTKLPPAVSLGFMPFTGVSQQWARKARELGHEVIVQLPLEPSDYPINNPGPDTLLTSSSGDVNLSRMGIILGRFENYSGVSNYLGGKILQSEAALRPIVQGLKSKGLIYVGEGNNSHVLLRRLAGEVGLRYGAADMMIDAHPAPDEIRKALEKLAELARKDGSAIGMGYASRSTIEQIQAWSQSLAAEGITLVPVGALAQTPGAS